MPSSFRTCWHRFEGKGHFMMIGYGRTSTIEQVTGLEAQIRDLKAAGAEKLFSENVSSVAPRKELEAAIEFARAGDSLVVTKSDRLARFGPAFVRNRRSVAGEGRRPAHLEYESRHE